jgi:hypothetical protein
MKERGAPIQQCIDELDFEDRSEREDLTKYRG